MGQLCHEGRVVVDSFVGYVVVFAAYGLIIVLAVRFPILLVPLGLAGLFQVYRSLGTKWL